jgi:serine/threonine protein kinase/Tfp pilus assembly protein PilF
MKEDPPNYNRQESEAVGFYSNPSSPSSISEAGQMAPSVSSASPSVQMLYPNQTVAGRYRIVRLLGKGGMGEVYAADDLELGERVALKILAPGMMGDPKAPENLKREILLARKVMHANICRTLEFGYHQAPGSKELIAFLTMEFLPGETLSQRLRRTGRMETRQFLPIVAQVVAALSAAHKAGVVHRDLKPSNILLVLSEDGEYRPVISDFGLARRSAGLGSLTSSTSSSCGVSGTWAYMAPEQVLGEPATAQADVYALGVVMFEMVTGVLPFQGDDAIATAFKRLQQDAPSPRSLIPELNAKWDNTILGCLMRDPERRFQNVTEVLEALSAPEAKGTPVQRPKRARGGRLLLLAIFALAFLLVSVEAFYRLGSYYISGPAAQVARPTSPPVQNENPPDDAKSGTHKASYAAPSKSAMEVARGPQAVPSKPPRLDAVAAGGRRLTDHAQDLLAQGQLQQAGQAVEQSLGVLRTTNDPQGLEAALRTAALIHQREGDLPSARTLLDEALAIDQRAGNQAGAAAALRQIGNLLYEQGEIEPAKGIFEQAVKAATVAGNTSELAKSQARQALVLLEAGDTEGARATAESAFSRAKASGDKDALSECQLSLGEISLEHGDAARAEQTIQSVASGNGSVGVRDQQLRAQIQLSAIFLAERKSTEARNLIESAQGLRNSVNDRAEELALGIAAAGISAAAGARGIGDVRQSLEDIIKRAKKQGLVREELKARLALGEAEMAGGQAGSGRPRLVALAKKARTLGMLLTAARADAARKNRPE